MGDSRMKKRDKKKKKKVITDVKLKKIKKIWVSACQVVKNWGGFM